MGRQGRPFRDPTRPEGRLALLLLEGGAWNGRRVIAAHQVDALFAGGDRRAFAAARADRPGWSYRDLWWHMGGRRIAALGVHGQRLVLDRAAGLALIRTGVQPLPDNRPHDAAHEAMLTGLSRDPR